MTCWSAELPCLVFHPVRGSYMVLATPISLYFTSHPYLSTLLPDRLPDAAMASDSMLLIPEELLLAWDVNQ